jgi:hypothetical protein
VKDDVLVLRDRPMSIHEFHGDIGRWGAILPMRRQKLPEWVVQGSYMAASLKHKSGTLSRKNFSCNESGHDMSVKWRTFGVACK